MDWRLIKYAAIALGAVVLITVVGGFLSDPFGWKEKLAQSWRGKAETAQAQATIAGGEAQVGQAAIGVVADAGRRDQQTANIQGENRHAILQSPGAQPPLDPDLARAFVDGLCRYEAYHADPGCAGLQPVSPDPQDADAGGPPTVD